MAKKRIRYYQVNLSEALGPVQVDEIANREHYENTKSMHMQLMPGVNRMRNAMGFVSCGVSNVIGDGYEAIVLYEGQSLSVKDQLRAEKMCEDLQS